MLPQTQNRAFNVEADPYGKRLSLNSHADSITLVASSLVMAFQVLWEIKYCFSFYMSSVYCSVNSRFVAWNRLDEY
jgi:hypothetical protein